MMGTLGLTLWGLQVSAKSQLSSSFILGGEK